MASKSSQQDKGFAQKRRKDKKMVQVAAALLFTLAAGVSIAVIAAMLKNNRDAILSALAGEGSFPIKSGTGTDPASNAQPMWRATRRRSGSFAAASPARARQFSRAA